MLVFHIDQQHGLAKFRLDLLRIEHVEENHLIAAKAQRLDGLDDGVGLFVEIRKHHHDAAAVQEILKMDEGLGEIGARAGLGASRWRAAGGTAGPGGWRARRN